MDANQRGRLSKASQFKKEFKTFLKYRKSAPRSDRQLGKLTDITDGIHGLSNLYWSLRAYEFFTDVRMDKINYE